MAQMVVKSNANLATSEGSLRMKQLVNSDVCLKKAMGYLGTEKAARAFLGSALTLYNNEKLLSECSPDAVMAECMKAATFNLPINKSLGFAYIVPYKNGGVPEPQFQLGYKGLIQLAQRSGQYRYINGGAVYEGMEVETDFLSGMLKISGKATSDKVVGYFGYFELLNGFKKAVYWTKEQIEAHAKKYSKAWKMPGSPWHTQFDAMAIKTVLRNMLTKYGILSIEVADAFVQDISTDEKVEAEVAENANQTPITIPVDMVEETPEPVAQAPIDDEEAGF